MPESPRYDPPNYLVFKYTVSITLICFSWSARHGRPDDARRAIAAVRALPDDHPIVEAELAEILNSIEYEEGISREKLVGDDDLQLGPNRIGTTGEKLTYAHTNGNVNGNSTNTRIQQNAQSERHSPRWIDCFVGFRKGSSRVGYRTLLGMSLQTLQQLTGANYLYVFISSWFIQN